MPDRDYDFNSIPVEVTEAVKKLPEDTRQILLLCIQAYEAGKANASPAAK